MLELYLDESGTHDTKDEPLLIMAGYLAEEAKWSRFNQRWSEVLRQFQIDRFHMKDLRNLRHKRLRHLSRTQRLELLTALIAITAETALIGTIAFLRPSDYLAVTDKKFRSRYGSAYGMLVTLTLLKLDSILLNQIHEPDTIRVFIEEGHVNAADVLRLLRYWQEDTAAAPIIYEGEPVETILSDPSRTSRMRIAEFGLGSKTATYPLHASDMLGYFASLSLSFRIDDEFTAVFDTLLGRIPHISTFWNRSSLEELVQLVLADEREKQEIRDGWNDIRRYLASYDVKLNVLPWGVTMDARHLSEEKWAEVRAHIKGDLENQQNLKR
ncbi:MAG TPA: hypothetical protein VI670_02630 [Thermoanaerobaculia bacterium]|jgi:hypothetical protein